MKKTLFFILTLANFSLFPSQRSKGFNGSSNTRPTTLSPVVTTSSSVAAIDTSNLNINPNASLPQEPLAQDGDNQGGARLQAPPPSPRIVVSGIVGSGTQGDDDDDFDTTADDDGSAARKITPDRGYLDEFWRFCMRTAQKKQELTDTIQERFGLVTEYDKLHKLAIEGKLEAHLDTLNRNDAGAGARSIDTAINTAIRDNNEPMLKQILLDIENISRSSLSEDTKRRISFFLIECSHKRKRVIIDIIATYLQECDQDARLVEKYTSTQSAGQQRYSFLDVMTEAQKKIEELTKHFSGETLLEKRK